MSPAMRRLIGLFRPYVGRLLLATLLMAAAAAIPGLLVLLIEQVLDEMLVARDEAALARLPFLVVGLYALNGVLNVARTWITRDVAWEVVTQLRRRLFAHLLELPVLWHEARPLGERLGWLTQDVGQVQYLVSAWATAVQRPLTLIGLVGTAFWMDWKLALAASVGLPLVAAPIAWFGRRLREAARGSLQGMGRLGSTVEQALRGLRTVLAFSAQDARLSAFDAENEEQKRLQMDAAMAQTLPGPVIELGAAVATAAVIAWGGRRVFAGELTPGELVAFLVAMGLVNLPLKSLSEVNSLAQRAVVAAERVFEILDLDVRLPEGDQALEDARPSLRFEGVGFSYGAEPVLRGLSLEVKPGEIVALVGPSGGGKSTLAALALRFFDPVEGRVCLGMQDLRTLRLAEVRRAVALVGQDSFLFDDSVLDAVRLGRPSATPAEVEAACRAAGAHDFVQGFPEGYATRVGEGGSRLSGGQRQRLCIARALLTGAPVLVLDEPSSALDPEAEAAMLRGLPRDRAILLITHRESAVSAADRVVRVGG